MVVISLKDDVPGRAAARHFIATLTEMYSKEMVATEPRW
jgi:hypothetical protein